MPRPMQVIRRTLGASVVVVAVAIAWLFVAPPAFLRIATGYSAKIVCSGVFVAGRDAGQVFAADVQAPGNPLLRLVTVRVDRSTKAITASFIGIFERNYAAYRTGFGCSSVPDGDLARIHARGEAVAASMANDDRAWPLGDGASTTLDPAIAAILANDALAGPGMRAIVAVRHGAIVGERYGRGFTATTPLLGWSLTKTVNAALVGTALDRIGGLDRSRVRLGWTDGRSRIRLADLMGMASGLRFDEEYGGISDANRMLFLEPDMASYAAGLPLVAPPGERFSYSSGTAVILARVLQDSFSEKGEGLAWPRRALFGPLGMKSAVLETDESGTFVASSYLYATARDWARFGQFLLQDGVWNGRRLVPTGFVTWMRQPNPVSGGVYGRGQLWLRGPPLPRGQKLPSDTFWMIGYDGQSIAIIPSLDLVVVRLGLTPDRDGFSAASLVKAVASGSD